MEVEGQIDPNQRNQSPELQNHADQNMVEEENNQNQNHDENERGRSKEIQRHIEQESPDRSKSGDIQTEVPLSESKMMESNVKDNNGEDDMKISILNFNQDSKEPPEISSPRSLQACQITGVLPHMLLKKTGPQLYKPLQYKSNLNDEGKLQLTENYEKRRQEKIAMVKEARERIITGELSKEEKKILHDSAILSCNSVQTTQSKLDNKIGSAGVTKSSFFPGETHFSWTSFETINKLERNKFLQKREFEATIGEEIKKSLMITKAEEKSQKLEAIAQSKAWERQKNVEENQENELLTQQKLEKFYSNLHQSNQKLEELVIQKSISTEHNINTYKEAVKRVISQDAQRKMMKSQNARRVIDDREEQKKQEFVKRYQEKLDKWESNQVIFQTAIKNHNKEMEEKRGGKHGGVFLNKKNIENHQNETNRKKTEKQEEDLRRWKENLSIRDKFIRDKSEERKNYENQVIQKKENTLEADHQKTYQNFQKRFNSLTEKHEQLQKGKQSYFMSVKSKTFIHNLNVMDNFQRIDNIQESKKNIITEKIQKRDYEMKTKNHEINQGMKDRDFAYTKLGMEKQKLKKDLDYLFQKCKKINIEQIAHKYKLDLDSEERLMTRSVADIERMKHTSKQSPNCSSKQLSQSNAVLKSPKSLQTQPN